MANTAKKQRVRGRPFQAGVSGKPAGRPKGALGKRTLLVRQLEASDPIELLEAQSEVAWTLMHYYAELKSFSMKDMKLAARIIISISDQMCAIAKMVHLAQAQKSKPFSKAEHDIRPPDDNDVASPAL
jgi:hypothetical protein